ncbi:MAG: RING-HC finger protein [Patescibacteria group bacterium]|jgi:hypothetical protein
MGWTRDKKKTSAFERLRLKDHGKVVFVLPNAVLCQILEVKPHSSGCCPNHFYEVTVKELENQHRVQVVRLSQLYGFAPAIYDPRIPSRLVESVRIAASRWWKTKEDKKKEEEPAAEKKKKRKFPAADDDDDDEVVLVVSKEEMMKKKKKDPEEELHEPPSKAEEAAAIQEALRRSRMEPKQEQEDPQLQEALRISLQEATEKDRRRSSSSSLSSSSSSSLSSSADKNPEWVDQAIRNFYSQEECSICCTAQQKWDILKPCGHSLCHACSAKVGECPFCRFTVVERVDRKF